MHKRSLACAALAVAMAVGCLVLWTGVPLAWLRIAGLISSTCYLAYLVALCGCIVTMAGWGWGLARVNGVYLRLRGREKPALLEVLLVVSAVVAFAAFLVWYFLLSGIPSGTPWPDETSGGG